MGALVTIIYVLLVAHFVADFICQSDWMATNKSTSWLALADHVAAYAVTGLMPVMVIAAFLMDAPRWQPLIAWWLVNIAAHFVTDAITSRINARLWFIDLRIPNQARPGWDRLAGGHYQEFDATVHSNKRHWFFVGIGADQLIHYVTLFVTAEWWLR